MCEEQTGIKAKLREMDKSDWQPIIVFFTIAIICFGVFLGFFIWHTVRMRTFELECLKMHGVVTDVKVHHSTGKGSGHGTYYYYVISFTYEGKEYSFTDSEGIADGDFARSNIGKYTDIYVHPQHPETAERVTSAGFVSIISACFFAFFCVLYAVSIIILLSNLGTSFLKRLLCIWGVEIALAVTFLLLFWLGLPNSEFAAVYGRIEGATGITVIGSLVALATLIDCAGSFTLHGKRKKYNL